MHGDAGPHSKHDSVNCYSCKSIAAPADAGTGLSHLLLFGIPTSCIATKTKCNQLGLACPEETLETIGRELVKDFNMLFDRHQVVIWAAPADCDHLAKDYHLPNHARSENCRVRCQGSKLDIPITDVSATAKWRKTARAPRELAKKTLTDHWLLRIKGCDHFTFHYDPMHCQEIGRLTMLLLMFSLMFSTSISKAQMLPKQSSSTH